MLHRNKNNKNGFTLVELMVVLAIMGILAALVGFGLTGYVRMARFQRNDSNARTVFQTAQIALTRKDTTGELDTFRTDVQDTYGVRGSHFLADDLAQLFPNEGADARTDKLNTYNNTILALYYDQNDPTSPSSQFVKDLLSPYVYDESLFSASICLEIDTGSGQVYSAFYDSAADKLRFDGDPGADGATSITDRSYDHRRNDSLVGYYSAEDTVNVVTLTQTRLKVKNPLLINNETLTLNWSGNSAHGDMDTVYDAVFRDASTDKYLFKLEISWTDALLAGQDSNAPIKVYKPEPGHDTEEDLQWADTCDTYYFPLSYSKGRFILTLDAMCDATLQRAAENDAAVQKTSLYSIARLTDGARDVYVTMKARPLESYADSYTESKPQTSNTENTLFAAKSDSETGTLKYFRHLYNLRYVTGGEYTFANNTTLNWTDGSATVYCAAENGGKPVPKVPSRTGEVVAWPTIPTLQKDVTLAGNGATIRNLQLRGSSIAAKPRGGEAGATELNYDHYIGLIGENKGTVQKLTLQDPDVQVNGEFKAAGRQTADAMAVDADNTLYLQPINKNSTEYRENVWSVGALAGMDSGTLTDCTVKANQYNAAYVGAVLTFSSKTIDTTRADGTKADGKKEDKSDIYDEPRGIGGLVGFAMPGNGQTLTKLTVDSNVTVAGLLQDTSAKDNKGTTDKLTADAAEKQRYNAIADEDKDNGHSLWRSVGVGGVAGVLDAANLTVAEGAKTQKLDAKNKATVVGNAFAGGIAGNLYTSIQNQNADCLAGLTNEGTVLAGANYRGDTAGQSAVLGQFFGGIAGYAKDVTLDGCSSELQDVKNETIIALVQKGYNADGTLKDSSPLKGDFVGGLVGFGRDIRMNNCSTQGGGYVLGRSFVGGLVGGFVGSDLHTTGGTNNSSVFGNRYVGGIVSVNGHNSVIDSMTNTGLVAGLGKNAAYVGGIAGVNDASWGASRTLQKGDSASLLDCASSMDTITTKAKELLPKLSTYGLDGATYYADFVGGIAGVNGSQGHIGWGVDTNGKTTAAADKNQKITLSAVLYGGSYVGGVVGYNATDATIQIGYSEMPTISGTITATGNCVGGQVGLNCASTLPAVTVTTQIDGMYYVGGIIGANLPAEKFSFVDHTGKDAAPTTNKPATILADGVVGGIIGYNQLLPAGTMKKLNQDNSLSETLAKRLLPDTAAIKNGLTPRYTQYADTAITLTGLNNQAIIKANAYVGGIIGYNAEGTKLTLADATNGVSGNGASLGNLSDTKGKASNADRYALTDGIPMTIAGEHYNGYFAGGIIGYASSTTTLQNCTNYGNVSHTAAAGGLAGVNDGCIICGNMGAQMGGAKQDDNIFRGGIAGINNGRIENTTVSVCSISGGKYIGGVAGYNAQQEGKTKGMIVLQNSQNSFCGTIEGNTDTGGIVGRNDGFVYTGTVGTFRAPYTDRPTMKVTGNERIGGIAGVNYGTISNGDSLNNTGYGDTIYLWGDVLVSARSEVGGAAGVNYGTVDKVTNKAAAIHADNEYAGGIAGRNYGKIVECQNSGANIYAGSGYAGGIAGKNEKDASMYDNISVTNSTITAANGEAGGIAAQNAGTIKGAAVSNATISSTTSALGGITAYNEATGLVTESKLLNSNGKTILSGPATQVGGLVGVNDGTLQNFAVENNSLDLTKLSADANTVNFGGAVGQNNGKVTNTDEKTDGTSGFSTVSLDIQQNMDKYLNLGGVAGVNNGTLEKCTYTGKLGNGSNKDAAAVGCTVGGIVGYNRPADSQHTTAGTVKNCTVPYLELKVQGASNIGSSQSADAKLTSAAHIGGVAGRNDGTLESCTVGSAGKPGSIITARLGFVGGVAGSNSGSIKNCGGDGTQELVAQINTWLKDVYVKDENGKDTTTVDTNAKNANLNQMVRVLTGKASDATETALAGKFTAMKGIDNVSYKGGATNQLTVTLQGGDTQSNPANGYLGGVTGFNSVSGQITDSASGQWFVYANNINQTYGAVGGIIGQNESNAAANSGLVNFAAVRRFVRGVDNTADNDANSGNDRYVKTERDTKADNYVGGVIGTQQNRTGDGWTLKNCVNIGNVFNSRSNNVGGVLAYWLSYGGTMDSCYNFGTLKTNANNGDSSGTVGGVAGYFDQPVAGTAVNMYRCRNYGSVEKATYGANDVAGIFGKVQMKVPTDAMTINIVDCVNQSKKLEARTMAAGIFAYIGPYSSIPNVKVNIDRCRNYCYDLVAIDQDNNQGTTVGIFGNRGNPGNGTTQKTTITNCFTLYADKSGQNKRAITFSKNAGTVEGWNNYYMDTASFSGGETDWRGNILDHDVSGLRSGLGRSSTSLSQWDAPSFNGKDGERSESEIGYVKAHRLYAGVDNGANATTDGSGYYTYFAMLPKLDSNGNPQCEIGTIKSSTAYIKLLDGSTNYSDLTKRRIVVSKSYNADQSTDSLNNRNGYVGQLLLLYNDADSSKNPSMDDITDETLQNYYTNLMDSAAPNAPTSVKVTRSKDGTATGGTATDGTSSSGTTTYGRYEVTWTPDASGASATYYHVRVYLSNEDGTEQGNTLLEADAYSTTFTFEAKKEWTGKYFNVEVYGVNSKDAGKSATLNKDQLPARFAETLPTPQLEVRLVRNEADGDGNYAYRQMLTLVNADEYAKVPDWKVNVKLITVTIDGNNNVKETINKEVNFHAGYTEEDVRQYNCDNRTTQYLRGYATSTDTDNWMRSERYNQAIYIPGLWNGSGSQDIVNPGLASGKLTAKVETSGQSLDTLTITTTLSFAKLAEDNPVYRVMLLGKAKNTDTLTGENGETVSLQGQYITLAAQERTVTTTNENFVFSNLPDDTLTNYTDWRIIAVPVNSGVGDAVTRWSATRDEAVAAIKKANTNQPVAWFQGIEIVRTGDSAYSCEHLTPLYFANTNNADTPTPQWAKMAAGNTVGWSHFPTQDYGARVFAKTNFITVAAAPQLSKTAKMDEPLFAQSNQLAYTFSWTQPDEAKTDAGQSSYSLTLYGQTLDDAGNVLREEVITPKEEPNVTYDTTTNTYRYTLNVDTDLAANSWRFDQVRLRVTRVPSRAGTVGAADTARYSVKQRLPKVGQPNRAVYVDTSHAEQIHYEISWPAVADTAAYTVDHYRLYAQKVDANGKAEGEPFELFRLETDENGDPLPITTAGATVNLEDHQDEKLEFYVVAYPAKDNILCSPNGEASSPQPIIKRTEAPSLSDVSFTWPGLTEGAMPLMQDFCQNLTIQMNTNTTAAGYFFTGYLFSSYDEYKAACEAANAWMRGRNIKTLAALNAALTKGTCLVPETSRSEGSEAKTGDNDVTYTVTPNANGFTMQPDNANQYLLPALRAMVASGTADRSSSTWTFFVPSGYESGADSGLHLPKIKLDTPMQGVASSTSVSSTVKGRLYNNDGNSWDDAEHDIGISQYAVQWSAVNEYKDANNTLRNYADTYQFHVTPDEHTAMDEADPNRYGYDVKFTVYTQDEYGEDADGNPVIEHHRGEIKTVEKQLYNENEEATGWFDITDTAENVPTDDGTENVLYDLSVTRQDKVDENGDSEKDENGNVITVPVSHPITLKGNYTLGYDRPQYQVDTVPTLCMTEMQDNSIGYRVTLPDMTRLADQDDSLTTSPAVYTKSVEVWAVGNNDKTQDSDHLTVTLRSVDGQQLPEDAALPVVESAPVQDTPVQTDTPAPAADTPADTPETDDTAEVPAATPAPDAPAESPAPTASPDVEPPAGDTAADSGSTPAPDASADADPAATPEPTPEPPAETTAPAA